MPPPALYAHSNWRSLPAVFKPGQKISSTPPLTDWSFSILLLLLLRPSGGVLCALITSCLAQSAAAQGREPLGVGGGSGVGGEALC